MDNSKQTSTSNIQKRRKGKLSREGGVLLEFKGWKKGLASAAKIYNHPCPEKSLSVTQTARLQTKPQQIKVRIWCSSDCFFGKSMTCHPYPLLVSCFVLFCFENCNHPLHARPTGIFEDFWSPRCTCSKWLSSASAVEFGLISSPDTNFNIFFWHQGKTCLFTQVFNWFYNSFGWSLRISRLFPVLIT